MHLFIRVCQMWSPCAYARPYERTSSPLFLYFCASVLCQNSSNQIIIRTIKKKSIDKHWLHSGQGRDCFTFSLNLLESALEVMKFLPSGARDPVQTETETTHPKPIVRCCRWHSLSRGQWSVLSRAAGLNGNDEWGSRWCPWRCSLEMFWMAAEVR